MGLNAFTPQDAKGNETHVRVYRNDKYNFPLYSISINSKDASGNWVTGYLDCEFKKGISLNNKTDIYIRNAFFIARPGKNNKTYVKLMITDYIPLNNGEESSNNDAPNNNSNPFSSGYTTDSGGFIDIPEGIDEELPFN